MENAFEWAIGVLEKRAADDLCMRAILNELKDLPHVKHVSVLVDLSFTIPYSLPMLNECAGVLKAYGWHEVERKYLDATGCTKVVYENPDHTIPLKIWLDTDYEGSTCKLNRIGERVMPIYETVCLEA